MLSIPQILKYIHAYVHKIDIYRYIYVEIYLHIQIHIYGSINQNSKTAERKHTQKIEPPNFPKSTETQY